MNKTYLLIDFLLAVLPLPAVVECDTCTTMLGLLLAASFLVLLVLVVIWSMYRIRKKNKVLVQRLIEQDRLEEELERLREELKKYRFVHHEQTGQGASEPSDLTDASVHSERFVQLHQMIKEKSLYTDPNLNRKELAQLLGTNETYLREAIKEETGLTFTEYINELRLDHAKKLLKRPASEYTIEAVTVDSGFGSRSTFYRLFRNRYELSPDEYRKLIN